jgi:hypothetical protein
MITSPIEGFVHNGQIQLPADVKLPENTKVFIVVPDNQAPPRAHISSPRLAHPEQAGDFVKQVIEVAPDAQL